jgi:hypothetical protein
MLKHVLFLPFLSEIPSSAEEARTVGGVVLLVE